MENYQIWVLCFCITIGISCSDFLEEESQDEVIPQTAKDYGELLLGSGYPTPGGNAGYIVSYMDDDHEFDVDGYNVGTSSADDIFPYVTWQPQMYEWGAGTSVSSSDYYMFFERIKGCNAVLDNIDHAIGTQEEKDQVKAEALAIRALHYFWLVNLYGEPYNYNKNALAVPLKLNVNVFEEGFPRNTVEEVYTQILNDLHKSIELFEKYDIVIGNYKINLPAAKILLSRVYLYMENWEEAVKAATDAIALSGDLVDLTQIDENTLTHMNSYDISEVVWVYGGSVSGAYGGGLLIFSDSFLSLFSPEDRRDGIYFIYNPYSWIYNKDQKSGEPSQTLRVAEAYLNRAEAYAQIKGKENEALSDLNTLRRHRITNYQNESINNVDDLLEAIRLERRKELCFEGHRWFDLRRYGMPSIQHVFKADQDSPILTYTLQEKDPMYTLPLPSSITKLNTALIQNSSAEGAERGGENL